MYLKSLSLKGFKSFPDRTQLVFAPGVSVIVGPNGCGKSNVTDAVLWALGEQSPTAIRGNSMQDVIFSGGKGSSPRRFAEVEVVIDNAEGRANSEFSEISVKRRIDRSGEGEYRLNGARCRLADIVEALADTNLGREMHSVISQGKVEQIVGSRPRERRLLVEEAAGLGKHRKRRRRAQLKLERTRDNLDRALDVEREARSRLRPLKRQAEAAERGAKLQAEEDEVRALVVAADLRSATDRLESLRSLRRAAAPSARRSRAASPRSPSAAPRSRSGSPPETASAASAASCCSRPGERWSGSGPAAMLSPRRCSSSAPASASANCVSRSSATRTTARAPSESSGSRPSSQSCSRVGRRRSAPRPPSATPPVRTPTKRCACGPSSPASSQRLRHGLPRRSARTARICSRA